MRKTLLISVLLISLFPTMLSGISCDGKSQVTTTPVKTTEIPDGQTMDVKVTLSMNTALDKGIFLRVDNVQAGTLQQSGEVRTGGGPGYPYYKGDRCLNIIGKIYNKTDQFMYMNMRAIPYNSDMKVAGMPISTMRSSGNSFFYLPENSVNRFEIIVTWSEAIKLIEISASSDNTTEYIFHEI